MIGGRKRPRQEETGPTIKRRREDIELAHVSGEVSVFDRTISSFGGWLRRMFGRTSRRTTGTISSSPLIEERATDSNTIMTTTPGPSSHHSNWRNGLSDSASSRTRAIRTESSRPGSIRTELSRPGSIRTESSIPGSIRTESSRPGSIRTESSRPGSITTSRPGSIRTESNRTESSSTRLIMTKSSGSGSGTSSVNQLNYIPRTGTVLDNMRRKEEDVIFKQLLDNRITGQITLDSLSSSPNGITIPCSRAQTTFIRDPSLSLLSPGLSPICNQPTPPPPPLPPPPPPPPVLQNIVTLQHNVSRASDSPLPSAELTDWITNTKERFASFTDYQARIEVLKKYARIHYKERIKAEDNRAEKLTDRIRNLRVSRWSPGIEDEPENELNLTLDEETNQLASDVWCGTVYSSEQVLSKGYNIEIKRRDLLTLRGLEWLNDEVINFYLNVIAEVVNKEGSKKIHLFNSFFYPKIMSAGYTGVRRWTKKVDIFAHDMILLPIHLGMHWCLAVIDFNEKTIKYYDSLQGNNRRCLLTLKDYLVSEAKDKKGIEYDVSEWVTECIQDIPVQYNGSDCGVFTCMYARHLARNKLFNFSQDDMPTIRRLMVAEIIKKQLL